MEEYLKPCDADADDLGDNQSREERLLSLFAVVKGALYLGGFLFTHAEKVFLTSQFFSAISI